MALSSYRPFTDTAGPVVADFFRGASPTRTKAAQLYGWARAVPPASIERCAEARAVGRAGRGEAGVEGAHQLERRAVVDLPEAREDGAAAGVEEGAREADEVVAGRDGAEEVAAEGRLAGAQRDERRVEAQAEDLVDLEAPVLAAAGLEVEAREERVEAVPAAVRREVEDAEAGRGALEGALRGRLPEEEPAGLGVRLDDRARLRTGEAQPRASAARRRGRFPADCGRRAAGRASPRRGGRSGRAPRRGAGPSVRGAAARTAGGGGRRAARGRAAAGPRASRPSRAARGGARRGSRRGRATRRRGAGRGRGRGRPWPRGRGGGGGSRGCAAARG